MQEYFEPEQAFSISMPYPVFEILIAYEKTCKKLLSDSFSYLPIFPYSLFFYIMFEWFEWVFLGLPDSLWWKIVQ